jgi:hypothetical protein
MLERNQAIKTIYSKKPKKKKKKKGGCMKLKRRQQTLMVWLKLIEDCKTRKGKEKKKIIDWVEKRQGKDHVVWESLDQKSRH